MTQTQHDLHATADAYDRRAEQAELDHDHKDAERAHEISQELRRLAEQRQALAEIDAVEWRRLRQRNERYCWADDDFVDIRDRD
jgi:hypothetical protein